MFKFVKWNLLSYHDNLLWSVLMGERQPLISKLYVHIILFHEWCWFLVKLQVVLFLDCTLLCSFRFCFRLPPPHSTCQNKKMLLLTEMQVLRSMIFLLGHHDHGIFVVYYLVYNGTEEIYNQFCSSEGATEANKPVDETYPTRETGNEDEDGWVILSTMCLPAFKWHPKWNSLVESFWV